MWEGVAGGERTESSSSSLAKSQGAKLLAPSKHEVLALVRSQDSVRLILQTSHAGHLPVPVSHHTLLAFEGAVVGVLHIFRVTDPGGEVSILEAQELSLEPASHSVVFAALSGQPLTAARSPLPGSSRDG